MRWLRGAAATTNELTLAAPFRTNLRSFCPSEMTPPTTPFLRSLPLGEPMPASVHAVTCSLPTMRDVIGYEEKDPRILSQITSGYPRFVSHFYLRRIEEEWKKRHGLSDSQIFFTSSQTAAFDMRAFSGADAGVIDEEELFGLPIPAGSSAAMRAKSFLQHTGSGISSRLAESYLFRHGLISGVQHEERVETGHAYTDVVVAMADAFGAPATHVRLASGGMNAFYSTFRAISEIQEKRSRFLWVQLGWLYVDTIEILRKMSGGDGRHVILKDVLDIAAVEQLLEDRGQEIAGFVTEVPTNPLIQTPDISRLRELTERYDIPLILDPTLASPLNIDVLPHCDVVVNSLTKYAGSEADVLMGAVVINPASPWAEELQTRVDSHLTAPFRGDVERMAFEISGFGKVVQHINRNTMELVAFLSNHPGVEDLFWAYGGESGDNYRRFHRRENAPGGVFSMKLKKPLAAFYDRVQLPKGPSFGAKFTLMCPFMYLAHYDLVSTEAGRQELSRHGIHPDLLRVSVGTEDIGQLITAFDQAL